MDDSGVIVTARRAAAERPLPHGLNPSYLLDVAEQLGRTFAVLCVTGGERWSVKGEQLRKTVRYIAGAAGVTEEKHLSEFSTAAMCVFLELLDEIEAAPRGQA